jgi:hypothetical protein
MIAARQPTDALSRCSSPRRTRATRCLVAQGNGVPPSSTIIAVLPAGYRPAQRQILSTYGGNPDGAARIDILPDGALTWVVGPASETDYTSLSGLSYWPD